MNGTISVLTIVSAMSRTRRLLCCAAFVAGAMILAASKLNSEEAPTFAVAPRFYDISAQTLDTALVAYIRASGLQVLYETALTAGQRSRHLKGIFLPDAALNALLLGTGLVAHRTDIDAFVITSAPASRETSGVSTVHPDGQFMTALQVGVLDALCRTPRTRPGEYKVAFELWIAPTGVVQRSSLIGSTGDAGRDRALLVALQAASIRMAPPVGLPQPLILTVGPRSPKETGDCVN